MINNYKYYINKICSVLKIKPPHISFDNSKFKSNTMLAMCETENNTIYLTKTDILTPDHIFVIAHELRHLWQFQNNKELFLSNYESVDKIGLEKYNSQLAEVDAHAFAAIFMIEFLNIKPLWHGLSANNIKLIENRMDVIIKDLI